MPSTDLIVYTAIAGKYDSLKPVLPLWQNEVQFVAFMDKPQRVPGWQIRPIHDAFDDPCRNAKIHKILPHKYFPEAKYSLWIDGCIRLKSNLPFRCWIEEYLKNSDLALCKHWCRNCVYQEGAACLKFNLDAPEVINRQMNKYYFEGYPANNGLAECTVILRRHTKAVERLDELWYKEIVEGSRRDQLSFNYVAHRLGVEYAQLPGTIRSNPHFYWLQHVARRSKPTRGLTPQCRISRR